MMEVIYTCDRCKKKSANQDGTSSLRHLFITDLPSFILGEDMRNNPNIYHKKDFGELCPECRHYIFNNIMKYVGMGLID